MSHIRDPHHGAQRARWSEQLREGFRTHKELNRPENLDPGLFYPDGGESGSSILIASLSTGLTPTTQEPNHKGLNHSPSRYNSSAKHSSAMSPLLKSASENVALTR